MPLPDMTANDILLSVCLLMFLVAVSVNDFRKLRIPNAYNILFLLAGLAWSSANGINAFVWALSSAFVTYLTFYAFSEFYKFARGHPGLGMGDVKFLGASASWIGVLAVPHMLLCASIAALTYVGVRACLGYPASLKSKIPFGPFLAVGFAVVWVMLQSKRLGLEMWPGRVL